MRKRRSHDRNLTRESWEITSREAWQARRAKDVTASGIAALFDGADEYQTIETLLARLDVAGRVLEREQTRSMRAGLLLEHCFPAAINEIHPHWRIEKARTYHRIPELRLGATPDFWIIDEPERHKRLLETKTIGEHRWKGRPLLTWTLQTLTEMLVTGCEAGILAVIVRNSEMPLYLYEVNRNPAAEGKILDAVAEFWRRYDAGEFPVPAPAEELAAMLDDGSHIDLSGDPRLPEWLAHRAELVETRSDCERRIKQYDYEIKQRMGAASTAWLEGWEISWKKQHRKEFTVAAQDIRVLRVKRTKESDDEIG